MFNTLIRLIAFPALCLIVAFGGVSHAQEGGEVSGIIAPEAEDSGAVVVPEGAIEWGAFGADAAPAPWTLVIPFIGIKRAAAVDVEIRDEDACRRALDKIITEYDAMTVSEPFCVSYDGDVKFFDSP